MLDADAASDTDRRPAIVICAYDVEDEVWDPAEDLSGRPWDPAGARTAAVSAQAPERLFETLSGILEDPRCRALLLVGRSRTADAFRVQMRAENRGLNGVDRLHDTLPAMARATLPVADIVRALTDAGLTAEATSEAEADAGSYLLYRMLAETPDQANPVAVGLLRAPETASDAAIRKAVKAAAGAIAAQLPPLVRPQFV